jgi:hypothetical protein
MTGRRRRDPLSGDWQQVLSGNQDHRSTGRRAPQHRAEGAFFWGITVIMATLGVAALAAGQIATGLASFGVAGLVAIISALVRLNWRILETNRELSEMNGQLLEERRAELLRRLRGHE